MIGDTPNPYPYDSNVKFAWEQGYRAAVTDVSSRILRNIAKRREREDRLPPDGIPQF